jgi:hypothetical protein
MESGICSAVTRKCFVENAGFEGQVFSTRVTLVVVREELAVIVASTFYLARLCAGYFFDDIQ